MAHDKDHKKHKDPNEKETPKEPKKGHEIEKHVEKDTDHKRNHDKEHKETEPKKESKKDIDDHKKKDHHHKKDTDPKRDHDKETEPKKESKKEIYEPNRELVKEFAKNIDSTDQKERKGVGMNLFNIDRDIERQVEQPVDEIGTQALRKESLSTGLFLKFVGMVQLTTGITLCVFNELCIMSRSHDTSIDKNDIPVKKFLEEQSGFWGGWIVAGFVTLLALKTPRPVFKLMSLILIQILVPLFFISCSLMNFVLLGINGYFFFSDYYDHVYGPGTYTMTRFSRCIIFFLEALLLCTHIIASLYIIGWNKSYLTNL